MNTASRTRLPLLLGLAHGLNDCAGGFLLGSLAADADPETGMGLMLLYNLLAFGGQLPVGMLLDQVRGWRMGTAAGVVLVVLSLLTAPLNPWLALGLAGLGSCLYHAGGGALALQCTPGSAAGPGLFAAPGVMGLALGGWLAWMHSPAAPFLIGGLLLALLLLVRMPVPDLPRALPQPETGPDRHDLAMILLILAISLRSLLWNVFGMLREADHESLLLLSAVALAGKAAGGWLADRTGWQTWMLAALLSASLLLSLADQNLWLLLPGVFLLQSVSPVALAALYRSLPQMPGTAAGMGLGLAIAVGGMPALYAPQWQHDLFLHPIPGVAGIGLVCALLAWLALRRLRPAQPF